MILNFFSSEVDLGKLCDDNATEDFEEENERLMRGEFGNNRKFSIGALNGPFGYMVFVMAKKILEVLFVRIVRSS